MSRIQEMLEYNKHFVKNKDYEPYETDSIPNKKMVIFTCMDSRLVEMLHKAMNIHNGDVKMVKNAGAIIRKPYDSIVKSILVAIYDLQAEEVAVITSSLRNVCGKYGQADGKHEKGRNF